jgi:hypothetical protein
MILKTATYKPTGFRYFYSVKRMWGATYYTADCSFACVGPDAVKLTWHKTLAEARKTAEERGTLTAAV